MWSCHSLPRTCDLRKCGTTNPLTYVFKDLCLINHGFKFSHRPPRTISGSRSHSSDSALLLDIGQVMTSNTGWGFHDIFSSSRQIPVSFYHVLGHEHNLPLCLQIIYWPS
jgi:hypothetical protein